MKSPMRPLILLAFTLKYSLLLAGHQAQNHGVTVDGELNDPFWQNSAPAKLTPVESGVALETGGEIRALTAGRYLYIGARLPEPSGHVTARSIGRNPNWEEGEDLLQIVMRVYNENDWKIQVGPFSAYSVKWRWTGESGWYTSDPEKCDKFLVGAGISEKEWSAEVAIPLSQLGSPRQGSIRMSVERVRAMRPGRPEERWRWPEHEPAGEVPNSSLGQEVADPLFRPAAFGNPQAPIEVGHRNELPPLDSRWSDPPWRDVPVWRLRRNEPLARLPRFSTEVKLIHNGTALAVMARCSEPDRVLAEAKERDGPVGRDDSFQVYLATTGSSYVHYAINPLGFILDASGKSGGSRVSRPYVGWNSPVRGLARQEQGEWIIRFDLPLESIHKILGETQVPRDWRILLLRFRPGRDGEPQEISVLPVTQSVTPICPGRYLRLKLVNTDPSQLHSPPLDQSGDGLDFVPTRVLSTEERKQMGLAGMLDRHIRGRVQKVLEAEKRDWDQVKTLGDWERFREPRLKALARSLGELPPRTPLQTRVTKEFQGEGYRRQDLVYQSRPGVWVPANLYLPVERRVQMPGIIIVHSLHGPRTQFELQDMGILWARAGCAVLIMDQIGHGERLQNYRWDREAYHSRYTLGMQLYLAGESLMTWMVWDIVRGVDLLLAQKDVNEKQIILLGAVAGGGDPAAVTAALDSRISAVVPFNFGEATPEIPRFLPEKNQWPLELADPGLYDWDSTRVLWRSIVDQFLPWVICASVAPRRFVYSYELGWDVEKLPAWGRYQRVFGFYTATDHLAEAHGFGPFPGPGECWNIGPAQRRSLHPTLERWFGIPTPFSELRTSASANLAKEAGDRRPESELASLNPTIASELQMRSVYELAHEVGEAKVSAARAQLAKLNAQQRLSWIQTKWGAKLGDIEPNQNPATKTHWSKVVPNAKVGGITLNVEPNVIVPLLLLRPMTKAEERVPVVVAVSEAGKDLFLAARAQEIESLLKRGIAVCLPDVRGTGETSPDFRRDPDGEVNLQANNELMLGETLLGRRLKDLRTVLTYLEGRRDLDPQRVGLWGDSFMPVNPARLILEEQPHWQIGPEIEQQAEPLGGLLALLGATYDNRVKAIAVRRGLADYLSVLNDRFVYVPLDIIVPGILEVGDIADVASALAPRPLLVEDPVDGQNRLIPETVLQRRLESLYKAYRETSPAALSIRSGQGTSNLIEWLLAHLK